jgi:hypothetical protein
LSVEEETSTIVFEETLMAIQKKSLISRSTSTSNTKNSAANSPVAATKLVAALRVGKAPLLGTTKAPGLGTTKAPGLGTTKAPGLGTTKAPGLGTTKIMY